MAKKSGSFHHGNLSDALVKAATQLITTRKATTFSVREVAQSLGVSHAAAYRHFKSKSDLLAIIAQTGFIELRDALEAVQVRISAKIEVKETLRAMGNAYIEYALHNAGAYRTLFHPDICDAALYPQLHEVSFASLQVLIDILELGQAQGIVAKAPNAANLATIIWSALHGYASLILDKQISETGEYFAPSSSREAFLDFIYGGLFAK